jgi:hypothetical protein
VHRFLVWCARTDTLNDPQEFVWQCDYTPTPATLALLTGVLVKARDRTNTDAQAIAATAIQNGRLEVIAKPVFDGMIEQCRNEIGLACFGATPDNPALWRRYGGDGAGVCIEFEVPADLLGTQLHRVEYPKEKRLHADQLMRAFVDRNEAQVVYEVALLSKPSAWADEEEIRFVSQRHSILVAIDRAQVPCVFLGDSLGADVRARIERIAGQVPLAERDR